MNLEFLPVGKTTLSDSLAQKIVQLIQRETFEPGDRLPPIAEMARRFDVGQPTLREALKRLEAIGVVDIRHGSGVYVGKNWNVLLISNPIYGERVSQKLLLDLIEARIPIEMKTAALAAENAGAEQLAALEELLVRAGDNLEDPAILTATNMDFHSQIAYSSGNVVLAQLLDVLSGLFRHEQRVILDVYGSRQTDHAEHLGILEAIQIGDSIVAEERMQAHLEGVREAVRRWDAAGTPLPETGDEFASRN